MGRRDIDFLILIESAGRGEVENADLIRYELINRGYTVRLKYYRQPDKFFLKPKVVIVPNMYGTDQIKEYCMYLKTNKIKVIDLQYEQVLAKNDEVEGYYIFKNEAKNAVHLCWGNNTYQRLLNQGINADRLFTTGHISMDFYSQKFQSLFLSKEELENKFDIPQNKKWYVYMSNFTFCDERVVKDCSTRINVDGIAENMIKSKKVTLEWITKFLSESNNNDFVFIYRPHPVEEFDENLAKIALKFDNFKYINEFSLKQWVRYADKVLVYYSTSIVDAYFCNKSSYIVRPYPIEKNMDSVIMTNATYITNYEAFESVLNNDNYCFPIDEDIIAKYYGEWKDNSTYIRITDICEQVYKDDKYIIDFSEYKKMKFAKRLHRLFMYVAQELNLFIDLSWLAPKSTEFIFHVDRAQIKNYRKSKRKSKYIRSII